MSNGLDLAALRKMQGGLKNKAGKGDGIYIYSNKLPEEMDIRLLPTRDNMNGIYFLEQVGWWINGNFHVVDADEDYIEEEIEMAKNHEDPAKRKVLKALIEKKKDNMPLIKKEYRYLLPILQLDCKYNDDEELTSFEVVDDSAKILIAKPTMITSINEVVTSRPYQNKTKWGMMDREKGFNMIIGKTGKGLNTEYRAIGWTQQLEMDEKYYADDKIPDIYEMNKKAIKSEEILRNKIRNYLYGEELIEESKDDEGAEPVKEETTAKKATSGGAVKRTSISNAAKSETKEEKPKGASARRSLLDDVEGDIDDLD